jgi:hypothetical protein
MAVAIEQDKNASWLIRGENKKTITKATAGRLT